MSIRGIDSQIMITRTPEAARDASLIQQRPEVNQQILAERQKVQIAQEQTRVKELEEKDMDGIRTDEDGGGGSGYDSHGGKHPEEEERDEKGRPGMLVPPGDNIFDIRI